MACYKFERDLILALLSTFIVFLFSLLTLDSFRLGFATFVCSYVLLCFIIFRL